MEKYIEYMKENPVSDLEKAKKYLNDNHYTLVMSKNNHIISSRDKGLDSLLNLYDFNISFEGYSVADKIVGKACAYLLIDMRVSSVYTTLITKQALNLLKKNNINVEFEKTTDKLIDKNKKICPYEELIKNCNDINSALDILKTQKEK